LCGISWVNQYSEYSEFNVRKYQELYASAATTKPEENIETREDLIAVNVEQQANQVT
jgi:hypothetical protein